MLFFSTTIVSNAQPSRDGNWWIQYEKGDQTNYLIGFSDGIRLGHNFSIWNFIPDNDTESQIAKKKAMESYQKYMNMLSGITIDQLRDGVDEIYKNYENRLILVDRAAWLAIQRINGLPDDEFNAALINHRKNAVPKDE